MTKFWIGTAGRAALVLAAAAALAACETRSQYAPYKGYAAPGGAEIKSKLVIHPQNG